MKTLNLLIASFAAALLGSVSAPAEDLLQVRFQTSCLTTNDAGEPVKRNVNNQTLIQDYASQNGVTNLRTLALVYHVNGDERGDVLQIVDAQNATILSHVLGFFFPAEIPLKPDGSQIQKITGIYNHQQAYSIGSAALKEKISIDRNGETNWNINGAVQFYLNPEGTNGLRLYTGTIVANKAFVTNSLPVPPTPPTNAPPPLPGSGIPGARENNP